MASAEEAEMKEEKDSRPTRETGLDIFVAEYFQAAVAIAVPLLRSAGGPESVLEEMWRRLPPDRRLAYAQFVEASKAGENGAVDTAAAASRSAMAAVPPAFPPSIDSRWPHATTPEQVRYLSPQEVGWADTLRPHYESATARAQWLPAMCRFWANRRAGLPPPNTRGRVEPSCEIDLVRQVAAVLLRQPGARAIDTTAEGGGRPENMMELRPCHFEASDWRVKRLAQLAAAKTSFTRSSRGVPLSPCRDWWQWVCDGACHALALLNLLVIRRVQPTVSWRLVEGPGGNGHATVWDGGFLLFDPQFEAMGVPAREAWCRAGGGAG